MKKLLLLTFVFMANTINAQQNLYKEAIKELIVIETLRAENRISDLSDFLREQGYTSQDKYFIKLKLENDYPTPWIISVNEDEEHIKVFFNPNELKNEEITKKNISKEWNKLLFNTGVTSKNVKLPYNLFKTAQEQFKTEKKDSKGNEIIFESIDRYNFRIKLKDDVKKKEWQTFTASNFSTIGSTERMTWLAFPGLGKYELLYFKFNKFKDKNLNDNVYPWFEVKTSIYDVEKNKDGLNIEFFMGIENFDDIIWADK